MPNFFFFNYWTNEVMMDFYEECDIIRFFKNEQIQMDGNILLGRAITQY